MKQSKLPRKWHDYIVKAAWRGTAIKLIIHAKDEDMAWDLASKKVRRMLGGQSCLELEVKGTI